MDEGKCNVNDNRLQPTLPRLTSITIIDIPSHSEIGGELEGGSRPNFVRRNVRRNANIYRFEDNQRLQELSEAYDRNLEEGNFNEDYQMPSIEDFNSVQSFNYTNQDLRDSACSICHVTFMENIKISLLSCGH